MKVFFKVLEWIKFRSSLSSCKSLGFIPTMGNLHNGHFSLFKKSKEENDFTIVSIFVNPIQFESNEEYISYPRTLKNDLSSLMDLEIDFCLVPKNNEIYSDKDYYKIQENFFSKIMEGSRRSNYITGMLTIVMKLLNITKPNKIYFGEKDYQQYNLVLNMIHAFFMNIEVKMCPTIREKSGLAYSSRNNFLTKDERYKADLFSYIFLNEKNLVDIRNKLNDNGIHVEYLEEYNFRRFIAVKIGKVCLIDNYLINK
ncbi:pantoate--beta-alanine ligase [Candidatus Legionella polyplacis]|uniref:pantoate--beta-alanine ligase n=1 Tax=Candidatus Legionella polyplacis TaxID=2005262 RepID=UPI000C1F666C|nr:pantoate--beta-alanine ligase [Candidatus Legionella polyplacis]ATW01932.1 pantoate--beta-alanine ligase [Candidatus Legionella polyplacis]